MKSLLGVGVLTVLFTACGSNPYADLHIPNLPRDVRCRTWVSVERGMRWTNIDCQPRAREQAISGVTRLSSVRREVKAGATT